MQLPGQSEFTRQTAPPFLQLPLAGHCALFVQAWLVLLHIPPITAQSLAAAHTLRSMLHWPTLPQSDCCMQDAPLMLHAPAIVGHCAFDVQLAPETLHLPGFGVHTGGAHVDTGVHTFSGSGGSFSQPGGEYDTVQTGC